jgi:hypothetical protein
MEDKKDRERGGWKEERARKRKEGGRKREKVGGKREVGMEGVIGVYLGIICWRS